MAQNASWTVTGMHTVRALRSQWAGAPADQPLEGTRLTEHDGAGAFLVGPLVGFTG